MTELGHFYAAFEERYRGTFENIKSRALHYLPAIKDQDRSIQGLQALDLGCGRGEWLELLRENGIHASGIDQNPHAAERARQRGLVVEVGDIFDAMARAVDGQFRLVSAFHVIEHLPWELQLNFFTDACRILAPGGMLIVEWPNPECLTVSALDFWLDPTHVRPVPPALLSFMAEYVGFGAVELKRLRGLTHVLPDSLRPSNTAAKPSWRDWFSGVSRSRSIPRPAAPSSVEVLTDMLNAGRDIGLVATKKSGLTPA